MIQVVDSLGEQDLAAALRIMSSVASPTIRQLIERVSKGEHIKVMGKQLDKPLQADVMTPIIDTNVSEGEKEWVELTLENGEPLFLTADHEVHTSNRGWVKAGELVEGDDVTSL